MACWSAVRWLCQVTVSGLVLSGCMLSAGSEDDATRWARDEPESVDFDESLKPESLTGLRPPAAAAPTAKQEPAPPKEPPELSEEEVEDAVEQGYGAPTTFNENARPTLKTDPQPEPQVPVIFVP